MKYSDHKEFKDQTWHTLSCFGIAFVGLPVIGIIPAVLFAITREYYQEKRKMEAARRIEPTFFQVIELVDLWKLDLKFSYLGAVLGNLAISIVLFVLWKVYGY